MGVIGGYEGISAARASSLADTGGSREKKGSKRSERERERFERKNIAVGFRVW